MLLVRVAVVSGRQCGASSWRLRDGGGRGSEGGGGWRQPTTLVVVVVVIVVIDAFVAVIVALVDRCHQYCWWSSLERVIVVRVHVLTTVKWGKLKVQEGTHVK